MTVEKPKPKQLLRPITRGAGSAMNQSQLLAITCNSLEARERSRVHGAIDFGFVSHWLKNWRESFKPITKRSNRNHGITFDSHLKTALLECFLIQSQIQAKSFLFLGFDEASGKKNFICYKLQLSMKFVFLDLLYFFFICFQIEYLQELL